MTTTGDRRDVAQRPEIGGRQRQPAEGSRERTTDLSDEDTRV